MLDTCSHIFGKLRDTDFEIARLKEENAEAISARELAERGQAEAVDESKRLSQLACLSRVN